MSRLGPAAVAGVLSRVGGVRPVNFTSIVKHQRALAWLIAAKWRSEMMRTKRTMRTKLLLVTKTPLLGKMLQGSRGSGLAKKYSVERGAKSLCSQRRVGARHGAVGNSAHQRTISHLVF